MAKHPGDLCLELVVVLDQDNAESSLLPQVARIRYAVQHIELFGNVVLLQEWVRIQQVWD